MNFVAIGGLILDRCAFTESVTQYLNNLSNNKSLNKSLLSDDSDLSEIMKKCISQLKLLRSNCPTVQLWIQYFNCIIIILNFYHAEQSGDFELHLKCIKEMIPYFQASGHLNYSKSANLYHHDMMELKTFKFKRL